MLLSSLEYTARTTGISVRPAADELLWTAADTDAAFNFTQTIGAAVYALEAAGGSGEWRGTLNGRELFTARGATRVVTNPAGGAIRVVGVLPARIEVAITVAGSATPTRLAVAANEVWRVGGPGAPKLVGGAPFTPPFD